MAADRKRIVVGISGATGVIYGIRLLEQLKKAGVETHLILTNWASRNIELETNYLPEDVAKLADYCHKENNLASVLASGSFIHNGMVVAPCSMKTLAALAHGFADNLLVRAADVTLKEGRKLVLMPRETPLNAIHLENMLKLAKLGVTIMPPMPSFYNRPVTLDDLVNQTIGRVLDTLGLENNLTKRWPGVDIG
ncbi:3-octaprenyl-4-hydroxybenzoate carboxy-lyase [Desulfotomaculum nigrificans CO-1-SRB]|uniref:Flavin prenyltransferase UbiX n=1 Tax=Desulfotomaculum nigrificans (strain DSM 14880 / VKM B-2319 / CO-1-SRB) TaxID=868595 RepID=F6B8T2_DESCC|nr:UbiX family flavin prenyltransferase [Desulfotomaculum nigrificans]AEF94775.1 3-octaprenyl-4-hydroxybenzoate carboxy-lyase [Desulfotomaculum nigrificans CO-1-SRB]